MWGACDSSEVLPVAQLTLDVVDDTCWVPTNVSGPKRLLSSGTQTRNPSLGSIRRIVPMEDAAFHKRVPGPRGSFRLLEGLWAL